MRYSTLALALIVTGYWIGVGVQVVRIARRRGKGPPVVPADTVGRILWLVWAVAVALWVAQPWIVLVGRPTRVPTVLLPIAGLDLAALHTVGLTLAGMAFAGTVYCWWRMGESWQMAFDPETRTPLVTNGLYRRIRHPIYLCSITLVLASVVVLPTPASVPMAVVLVTCWVVETIREERHLLAMHGATYQHYMARTGRFLPRLFAPTGDRDVDNTGADGR